MMYSIKNNLLHVSISSKGAELQSILGKDSGLEYMWSGDPAFWGKKSPVLFPVVGGLKKNSYEYNGNIYSLSRHGFARDMEFEVSWQKEDAIMFTLHSSEETLTKYPFKFSFSIRYNLHNNELNVTYIVQNTDAVPMFFSVGGHPAFKIPLVSNTSFEDYYLQFSNLENGQRWPLSKEGLIENHSVPAIERLVMPLHKSLFYEDALVFKHLASKSIFIRSKKTSHGLKIHFNGFPYLGIWSAKDADFVCIEPWCGIADTVDTNGKLNEKEGINELAPNQSFERTWSVEVF